MCGAREWCVAYEFREDAAREFQEQMNTTVQTKPALEVELFTEYQKTWGEARDACKTWDGDLVAIRNTEEFDAVKAKI